MVPSKLFLWVGFRLVFGDFALEVLSK